MNTDAQIIAAELAETCTHGVRMATTDCAECEAPAGADYFTSPEYLAYCAKNGISAKRPTPWEPR